MSKVFKRTFRVRWSETNANGQVGVSSYLRYLMETAWDWGAAGQLSLDDVKALGQTWVVRETEFNFFRPLYYNDLFEFTIWMVEWRRVRGTRAFEIKPLEGGEVVAQGLQQVARSSILRRRIWMPPIIIGRRPISSTLVIMAIMFKASLMVSMVQQRRRLKRQHQQPKKHRRRTPVAASLQVQIRHPHSQDSPC